MDKKQVELTSDFLENVVESFSGRKTITFSEILQSLHERGFGVLLMVFNLPNLLPIPGLTIIGAVPIIFFAAQMMAGLRSPWLPKWLGSRTISYDNLRAVLTKYNPYIRKCEKLIKPRMLYFSDTKIGERAVGISCLIFAVVFALPIPLANFFPVIAVLLISIGFFNKDGLAILIGIITGIVGIFIAMIVVAVGVQGLHKLMNIFGI